MKTFAIKKSVAREVSLFSRSDPAVPQELFSQKNEKPCLDGISYPLPAKKSAYTCFAETKRALWLGAPNGVTRYEAEAEYDIDRVMFFTATRELADNDVQALFCDGAEGESVWVLTASGAAHIELKYITAEEKAEILTSETEKYVSRRGMVTARELSVPREAESAVPYGASDNSGDFTAGWALGELFKYAVYKREYGAGDERTRLAEKSAVRAIEACQLLMYMPGRGDGFVARDYHVPTEPLPDGCLLFRKTGDKTVCVANSRSKNDGLAGAEFPSPVKIPDRLAALYRSEGYSDDGIVYRGDTSSDEITLHFLLIYFAHEILGGEDGELDRLMINSAKAVMRHIMSHGNELCEFNGQPTTWARWSKRYFSTLLGWSDACLNSAELLMYLKIVMHITGEKGEWLEYYNHLINDEGYAELAAKHEARFYISSSLSGCDETEDLMYGDNMLATAAYWILCTLETDGALREKYKNGFRAWNGTFRREHNPAYDIPYMLSCPEDAVDTARLAEWFRRNGITRLKSDANIGGRFDTAKRRRRSGKTETSFLLPPDENAIGKYDRNPYDFAQESGGEDLKLIESGYVYTFAYWLGRYYGFIEEDKK